jgi:hypothetical protein
VQDKCVEIVAAAARVSLSVRPSSSQLKKRFQRVLRQNGGDKNNAACGPAAILRLTSEPTKFPSSSKKRQPTPVFAQAEIDGKSQSYLRLALRERVNETARDQIGSETHQEPPRPTLARRRLRPPGNGKPLGPTAATIVARFFQTNAWLAESPSQHIVRSGDATDLKPT